jgi:hypothetical protein
MLRTKNYLGEETKNLERLLSHTTPPKAAQNYNLHTAFVNFNRIDLVIARAGLSSHPTE